MDQRAIRSAAPTGASSHDAIPSFLVLRRKVFALYRWQSHDFSLRCELGRLYLSQNGNTRPEFEFELRPSALVHRRKRGKLSSQDISTQFIAGVLLARAPHHRKARVDAVADIARTDADKVTNSAKPPISTHQCAQPVAAHHLIAIEMSPVRPLSKATIASRANVQIIGNANEPKLQGIESQASLQDPTARTHECGLDLHTRKSVRLRSEG